MKQVKTQKIKQMFKKLFDVWPHSPFIIHVQYTYFFRGGVETVFL